MQSRIKAIEKEVLVEQVEEEEEFHFSFTDAGQIGRPVIQVEGNLQMIIMKIIIIVNNSYVLFRT